MVRPLTLTANETENAKEDSLAARDAELSCSRELEDLGGLVEECLEQWVSKYRDVDHVPYSPFTLTLAHIHGQVPLRNVIWDMFIRSSACREAMAA
ncbi:hypothetical protein CDL15_Pgr026054 [Punica granatum]|uniref:Uncharacterized protein n=1 Tax=Punica granatum TaxID=22663 RepID=A0A218WBF3_PUNGR|nr:hypothetical protein CDL15_Pgr026054 [Punica granatum]